MKKIIGLLIMTILSSASIAANTLPVGFAYLNDTRIILEMNYVGDDNFIGRPIKGYYKKVCILSEPAITALTAVQNELDTLNKGYVLKIFDSYRPTTAVADFQTWAQDPADQLQKSKYYPNFTKPELFENGYICARSSHSRGSTVDLTIVMVDPSGKHTELDMGTGFDFFGEASNTDSKLVSETAQQNRQFFKALMDKHGFENLPNEWWHFTLRNEPFPDTYYDFPVA